MTTPEAESTNLGQRHEHARPVRFSKEVRLPLAIRKELLITRAALERYDAAQALHHVKGGARRMTSIGTWLPRLTQGPAWLKLMGLTREYPMVSTAITLALPLLRRTPIGRIAWKLSKVGALAGAGYLAFKTLKRSQGPAADSSPDSSPDSSAGAQPTDTGFRDPLVHSPTETSRQQQP
jgi:hypothetical protein